MQFRRHTVFLLMLLLFNPFGNLCFSQRILLPPTPQAEAPIASGLGPTQDQGATLILKTYPDGTKKVVPLEALNFRDNGAAFGGPPQLSLYPSPTPSVIQPSQKSPERLTIAPIGATTGSTSITANVPASADPLSGAGQMASADPMAGGSSSGPIDPLAGSAPKTATPLQTVSGKPAPVVGDGTMVQLGEWDSFFLNAGIGGTIQGQLTAERVWNGTSRQGYPYTYTNSLIDAEVSGENFTFNPGFRLDVEFGYNFYDWLGIGLQTGLTYNGISQYNVDLATTGTIGGQTFDPGSYHFAADGELVQVPVQLNGYLRWPGNVRFRPFMGAGLGAVWQQLDVNSFYAGPVEVSGNYCRSAFQFGWNAQAGLTYTVEPGLDFYGAFKVLGAFMPVIGNYQFQDSYNFAIEVGVQSRF